ncbi:DUF305 domain-containing protein [Microbacterium immunditiarum]|uniref:Uncharacterized protein (DUF305 family) n=1 Tax=Microbacterium immunditiarum TaxID=337480 RepID=A0A7Y9KHB9_9MICO|nr:DUF305 domain-containing protein [Microbacterium immunditiarum]NYE19327.1 uncharacterized protein (DUF305 family) [Microbacterium immunditiarum]
MRTSRTVAAAGAVAALGVAAVLASAVTLGHVLPSSAPDAAQGTVAAAAVQPAYPIEADYCYVEAMVPHHEQALVLSELVLAASGVSDRTRALAEFIVADQTAEIEQMSAWLDAWARALPDTAGAASGHGADGGHAVTSPGVIAQGCGHDGHAAMMGMATDEQLAAFRSLTGAAAERTFLELMIVHHEGALEMARTAVTEGSNAFVRSSAKHVLVEQEREVGAMTAILETVS